MEEVGCVVRHLETGEKDGWRGLATGVVCVCVFVVVWEGDLGYLGFDIFCV